MLDSGVGRARPRQDSVSPNPRWFALKRFVWRKRAFRSSSIADPSFYDTHVSGLLATHDTPLQVKQVDLSGICALHPRRGAFSVSIALAGSETVRIAY